LIRYLPFLVVVILTIYTAIDCLQAEQSSVRNAPKWAWFMLILVFPLIGSLSWLVAGRPLTGPRPTRAQPSARPRPAPLAPDDDPEFLASIRDLNASHERVLEEWEADLRRREQELRDRESGEDLGESDSR
jgi:hypothetical protein